MSMFRKSIASAFRGSAKTFRTFPAVMAFAIAFTLIIFIKIESGSRGIQSDSFLLDCLQWALALGAIFSMAAITLVRTRFNNRRSFVLANLAGLAVVLVSFMLLYFFSGVQHTYQIGLAVSSTAASRMVVAIGISLLAFIAAAAYPPEVSDFSRSFFMTHKAFFIALIYGLVIGGGTSAVAAAIEALLFPDMSGNVYAYLSTLAGFLAFTIFVGYFPDFERGADDPRRAQVQDQPRFIEILLEYILIPIMLAFTVVLLAWVVRILLPGDAPLVGILSGTIGSYAMVSIWLHIMVTHYESKLAGFYRLVSPFALLIIIAFSIGTLTRQINQDGLTTEYYVFILICIFAAISAILLILMKRRAHFFMVLLASILAIIAVLPVIGIEELPVRAQINRLEQLLADEGMLMNGELTPATEEPEDEVRAAITNAVMLLAWNDEEDLPDWFDPSMAEAEVFSRSFGFDMTGFTDGPDTAYRDLQLFLPKGQIDISDYTWALKLDEHDKFDPGNTTLTADVQGQAGKYQIEWIVSPESIPRLQVSLDDEVIIDQDLSAYVDQLLEKFPFGESQGTQVTVEDMSHIIETPETSILLVFEMISISQESNAEQLTYWFELREMFLREK